MATSDATEGQTAVDAGNVKPSRRKFSSNIGVRRQHAHVVHRLSQAQDRDLDSTVPTLVRRSIGLGKSTQSRRQISFHSHSTQSQVRQTKHGRSQYTAIEAAGSRVRKAKDGGENESMPSYHSLDETAYNARSSSEEISPPTILVNPDLQLLPVVKTDQARASFDFYINSYATSIIEVSPQSIGDYPNIVHQILHDELLFTAFTTCSEAARWRTQSLYDDPPVNIAKGYGKTISLLSQRLQSEKSAMSSTILLTMGQLTAIETLIKNFSATARHLAGMQSVMRAKAGNHAPEGSSPVQTAVEIWTQYFMHRAAVKSQIRKDYPLTYPHHPFSPDLSVQIAELPVGFAEIALSGRCSLEILALMKRFDAYFERINEMIKDGITDSPERTQLILQQAAYCMEYFQLRQLTLIERLVLGALTAYVVRRDRVHSALINVRNYFQITCAYSMNLLNAPGTNLHSGDQESRLITWIGLMLLLTSTPDAHARKLALKLLPSRPEPVKTLQICEEFYWDDELTHALLSGSIISANLSNDVMANNIKQILPEEDN